MTRKQHHRRVGGRTRFGGFSLLETTIAVGILGVGLILVASVFPVALTQHRMSVEHARAAELVSKAESLMRGRLDPTPLWVDPAITAVPGTDSPWYLLPTVNVDVGAAAWDAMPVTTPQATNLNYADVINGTTDTNYDPSTNPLNPILLFGLDLLSDRVAPGSGGSPFSDDQLMEAPNRMVWYGFYRRPAAGPKRFAAAVCKQRKNQIFVEQDLSVASPYINPTASVASARRLPVPWRVTVGYAGGNVMTSSTTAPVGLAQLAPIGTKIMIQGTAYAVGTVPVVPAGRILTVSDIIDNYTVEVVGDLNDVPVVGTATFDMWVFPPAFVAGDATFIQFDKESPLMDWTVDL